ncbi:PREDICTED: myosin-G heavy chain-like [Bactrocera latifrons]|uniref:myosin-G heavy chain-like n=1 Tax=Bactrocera latifrons TaxID=174628 RepID=UPI0008DC90CC|nr:PREDICTED: myosin-G heavy chain-like [Bactrocera latifrons]
MSVDVAASRQYSENTTITTTSATTTTIAADTVATKAPQWSRWTALRWPIGLCEIGESTTTTTTTINCMATTKALQSKRVDSNTCRQQRDEDDRNNNHNNSSKNNNNNNNNKSRDINVPSAQRVGSQKRRQIQQQKQLGQQCSMHKQRQKQQQNWRHYLLQPLQRCASAKDADACWPTRFATTLKQQQQWLRFCLLLVICLSLPSATNTKPQTSATAPATIANAPTTLRATLATTTTGILITTAKPTATISQTAQSATESDDNIVTNETTNFTHTHTHTRHTTNNAHGNVIIPSTQLSVNSTTASKAPLQTLAALTVGALTVSTALPVATQTYTSTTLSSSAAAAATIARQSHDTTTTAATTMLDCAVNALAEAESSGGDKPDTQTAWNAHSVNGMLHDTATTATTSENESPTAKYHSSNNNIIRNAPSGSNTRHSMQQLSPTNANTDSNNNYISEDGGLSRIRHHRATRSVGHGSPGSVGLSGSSFGAVSQGSGGSGLTGSGSSGVVGLSNTNDGENNNHNSIECPSFDENSACPCYKFEDGLFLECPGTTAMSLRSTLERISSPIHSLSIYDFDRSVTSLSQDVFQPGVNIRHLQFSHSHLETLKDNSLRHVRATLESLSIVNGKLTQLQ